MSQTTPAQAAVPAVEKQVIELKSAAAPAGHGAVDPVDAEEWATTDKTTADKSKEEVAASAPSISYWKLFR
jgi:hypothetical protein